jgi:Protein of unknown function (DUF4239)
MAGLGLLGLWLALAAVVVVSILVAVGSVWLAGRGLAGVVAREHNAALSPFLTVVGLVYGALLGFTVVVAWEQFSSAEVSVTNEASTLTTMYRQTVAMPQAEQATMRQLLRKYTNSVVGQEWTSREGASDTARAAINEMYRTIAGPQADVQSSAINQDFLSQLTVLASNRNVRILDAKPRIPWLLWFGLISGGVVLVVLIGFLRLDSVRAHVILSSAVAILLGLLLFIVFVLDHPFGSRVGITSAPFEQSLEVFDAIDRGT